MRSWRHVRCTFASWKCSLPRNVDNPFSLVMSHSPIPPSQKLSRMASSSQSLSGGIHVSQSPTPCYRCSSGGVEKRHVKWETELGQITPPLGPLHSGYVSGGRSNRRWAWRVRACLVRLPQGGSFTAPEHMKCWLVLASRGETRDKWRGKQMSGGRRGGGGGTTGPQVPTRLHTL